MLPTIRSRCQEIKFPLCSEEEVTDFLVTREKILPDDARAAARFSLGSLKNALEFLDQTHAAIKEDALDIIECIAGGEAKKALDLAADYARTPLSENIMRLKFAAAFLREMELTNKGLLKPHSGAGDGRLQELGKRIRPGLFTEALDKISTAISALEAKTQPEITHAAFFLSLMENHG
jgi:DNA polymerase III gamma/tau subunit